MLVETVPNLSLGPGDPALDRVLEALEQRASPGWALLDVHTDRDHHRTVLTMAGAPVPLLEAYRVLVNTLVEHASLAGHIGVHPRLGMLDVAPFVALDALETDAVRTARTLSDRLARRAIPVYGYGKLATRPDYETLAAIRKANRTVRPGQAPEIAPDRGPARFHETMGAACVGVRGLLVAYNVLLDTKDLDVGATIARRVRTSTGGLPGVQALAFPLASKDGLVQVSTNIVDVEAATCADVYQAVLDEADQVGVDVLGGELVGLAPRKALSENSSAMGLDEDPTPLEVALERHGFAPDRPVVGR